MFYGFLPGYWVSAAPSALDSEDWTCEACTTMSAFKSPLLNSEGKWGCNRHETWETVPQSFSKQEFFSRKTSNTGHFRSSGLVGRSGTGSVSESPMDTAAWKADKCQKVLFMTQRNILFHRRLSFVKSRKKMPEMNTQKSSQAIL